MNPETTAPFWIGLDVAKRTFEAAVHPPWRPGCFIPLSSLRTQGFPRTREGVGQLVAWLDGLALEGNARAVMEATGKYSVELTQWLVAERPTLAPAIADPKATSHFIRSLKVRNKTDRADAAALDRFGAERAPAPWVAPAPEYEALREMSRQRDFLVETLVAAKNRLEEVSHFPPIAKPHRRIVAHLEKALAEAESLMHRHVDAHAGLRETVQRLDTIPGVAFITASAILGELGDLTRFHTSRRLSAFAGTSPRQFQSGESVKGKTRMSKQGSPRARQALYMASVVTIRMGDNALARFYADLVAKGKPKMAAIGAVMRKMLVLMRALLVGNADYQETWPRKKVPFGT